MKLNYRMLLSITVAILAITGFLTIPYLDDAIKTCTGSAWCGQSIIETLGYLDKADTTKVALGKYYYDKIITGIVVFMITLTIARLAHRAQKKLNIKQVVEDPTQTEPPQSQT
jgi:hypothetical protein